MPKKPPVNWPTASKEKWISGRYRSTNFRRRSSPTEVREHWRRDFIRSWFLDRYRTRINNPSLTLVLRLHNGTVRCRLRQAADGLFSLLLPGGVKISTEHTAALPLILRS